MNSPTVQSRVTSEPELENGTQVNRGFWHSAIGAICLALIATCLIFFVSSAADLFMFHEHEPARVTIEISDAISSAIIGLLSYQLLRLQQQRREQLRRRVEMISDMNHHVRNALQVISLTTHGHDQQEIKNIRESMNRIQWALRELLPKI
jgi:signal transduction histidine kinase